MAGAAGFLFAAGAAAAVAPPSIAVSWPAAALLLSEAPPLEAPPAAGAAGLEGPAGAGRYFPTPVRTCRRKLSMSSDARQNPGILAVWSPLTFVLHTSTTTTL